MAILKETFSQDLSAAAHSVSYTFNYPVVITEILIHASANITETITVTHDSADGANYDTVLNTTSLSAEANYVFRPTGQAPILAGDAVKIAVTNANTTGTIYGTLFVRTLAD